MAEMAILSTVGSELKSGIQQAIQPLVNNANELKQAGLTSLVKSISIAAEPALDVLELISEEIAPVFQPLFDILADAIVDELPNIQSTVEELKPTFQDLASRVPELVQYLPDIVTAFINFTAFNWNVIIAFLEVYGEDLTQALTDISSWLIENNTNIKDFFEAFKALFTFEGLDKYANGGV